MSLKKKTHDHIRNAELKKTLLELDDFLDIRYDYRREDRYKGWFGRLRAEVDRDKAEERERELSGEHWWVHGIQGSDPWSYEEFVKLALEEHRHDNFSVALMRLIEAKGMDAVTVYKRANIDRKLFSKIKTNINYLPSKKTVLALAIALELSHEETLGLLRKAGFSLSSCILSDVIVEFFITHGKYDMDEINAALYAYDQPIF